jgi:hypothetical protein
MVQVASQGLLFGSGPTLTSGRQKAALVHGARWESRAHTAVSKIGGFREPSTPKPAWI